MLLVAGLSGGPEATGEEAESRAKDALGSKGKRSFGGGGQGGSLSCSWPVRSVDEGEEIQVGSDQAQRPGACKWKIGEERTKKMNSFSGTVIYVVVDKTAKV